MQQMYKGVPVFGAEAIVHVDNATNAVVALSDGVLRDVKVRTAIPVVTAREAEAKAQASLPCPHCMTAPPKTALIILRHGGHDELAWKVKVAVLDGSSFTALPVVFIDAASGSVLWSYNNLQTGSGESLYSGTVALQTHVANSDGLHHLEDLPWGAGTFDYAQGTSSLRRLTDTDDVWNGAAQRAAVDAQFGAVATLRYYKEVYGWHGIDGHGGPGPRMSVNGSTPLVTSAVHYGSNYANAFWNGSHMSYGDGDGSSFAPPVSLDLVAHEMTHGLTQYTAGLIYEGESGALNESISDVFGAMVEMAVKGQTAATWRIGEACYTPGNGDVDALRFLNNPHLAVNRGYTGRRRSRPLRRTLHRARRRRRCTHQFRHCELRLLFGSDGRQPPPRRVDGRHGRRCGRGCVVVGAHKLPHPQCAF
jgi:Zn-dependent metalloprotease